MPHPVDIATGAVEAQFVPANEPVADRLATIYVVKAGVPTKPSVDIISIITSIISALLQSCLGGGTPTAGIAAAMKERPVRTRALVRLAMMQAHVYRMPNVNPSAIFNTIVQAGTDAQAKDVEDFLTENDPQAA